MEDENYNEIIGTDPFTHKIICAAIEVHKTLGGPGLLESIYETALYHELQIRGFDVQRQVLVPVIYKGVSIKDPLYIDIFVDNKVIIEVKAAEKNNDIHKTQLLTYLRLTGAKIGLLLNFGCRTLKEGIARTSN